MFCRTATFLTALSLAVGSANAYSNLTSADELEIQAIEAHFSQSLLVPSFLSSFSPQALLDVSWSGYGNGIEPGTSESKDAVAEEPYLEVIPSSNASSIASGSSYAVMMVDADIAGTESSTFHWLAYNVALPSGDAPYQLPRGGDAVIAYVGPGPLEGTGAHRYVVMVYTQPSGFTAPSSPTTFGAYDFESYISSSGLGDLVAANYFTVENGQATVTPSSTSAVQTSTLAAAASTSSAASSTASASSGESSASHSASSHSSGSASKSASATRSGASGAATSSSAADKNVVIAGAGILGALMSVVMAL